MGLELRKMRMNKRGQEADTKGPGAITATVIALAVLVLVVGGLWIAGKNNLLPWAKGIASLNDTKSRIVSVEIVGYDIENDKAKYYDGSQWGECGRGVEIWINDKKVQCDRVKEEFRRYFFSSKNRKSNVLPLSTVELENGLKSTIEMRFTIVSLYTDIGAPAVKASFGVRAYNAGERIFDKVNPWSVEEYKSKNGDINIVDLKKDGVGVDPYVLQLSNQLIKLPKDKSYVEVEKLSMFEQTIRYLAFEWRDSFFGTAPISFSYTDPATKTPVQRNYCFRKINYESDKFLAINLMQPVDATADCTKAV